MTLESEIPEVPSEDRHRPLSRYALPALAAGALAVALTALGGFGVRLGIWDASTGIMAVRMMLWGGVAAAVLAGVALFDARPGGRRRGSFPAFAGLLLSLLVVGTSLKLRSAQDALPPIHDISTDVMDPPPFLKIAELRSPTDNSVDYPGESTARIQEVSYSDVQPILLQLPQYDAYLRALEAAEASGWEIVDANERDGRIEATTRTGWFGFREDVVVRLTAVGGRTVVDVRSASRDREADLGSNAQRIRRFLDRLDD